MNNKQIAKQFNLLANIMELHDENPFKIRSYSTAYNNLRKLETPLAEMLHDDIEALPGVGKAILEKIIELLSTGQLKLLKKYKDITPIGVVDMLQIRGLGPKKIKSIWQDLEITSPSDLLYACNENRLVELKGFGEKTQDEIKKKIEYFLASQGLALYGNTIDDARQLLDALKKNYPNQKFALVGLINRKMPVIDGIHILTTHEKIAEEAFSIVERDEEQGFLTYEGHKVIFTFTSQERFGNDQFILNGSKEFIDTFGVLESNYASEEAVFADKSATFVVPEYRELSSAAIQSKEHNLPSLISVEDINGVVHSHSTYSDGIDSLRAMANAVKIKGYTYLVITDHSQSAGYAQGLKPDRVKQQWDEIDQINQEMQNFSILKGIESDILIDGRLDYTEDILSGFDVVIASVHSVLTMDEKKATQRLIAAIENPFTTMLGHPTGRLLLGRPGYPIDHEAIIQACAKNNVAIELNANPQRLDLDWTWISYAMQNNVKISINPDAHSVGQIDYIKYGVDVGRKAGMTADHCLNSLDVENFQKQIKKN
jgi:DNA polymerase (family X)